MSFSYQVYSSAGFFCFFAMRLILQMNTKVVKFSELLNMKHKKECECSFLFTKGTLFEISGITLQRSTSIA